MSSRGVALPLCELRAIAGVFRIITTDAASKGQRCQKVCCRRAAEFASCHV